MPIFRENKEIKVNTLESPNSSGSHKALLLPSPDTRRLGTSVVEVGFAWIRIILITSIRIK
jgi:hypothetical protein